MTQVSFFLSFCGVFILTSRWVVTRRSTLSCVCIYFSYAAVGHAPLCFGSAPAGVQSMPDLISDVVSCTIDPAAGTLGYPGRLAGSHQIFR